MTLDEAKDFDWAKLDPKHGPLKPESTLHFRMTPHVGRIIFDPPIRGNKDGKAAREGRLVCSHSKEHGSPFEYAQRLIFKNPQPETLAKLRELESLAVGHPNGAAVHASLDMSHYTLRFRNKNHKLGKMTVVVQAVNATTKVECKAYEMDMPAGKKIFHHLTATLGEQHIQWVMAEGLSSKKIGVKFGRIPKVPKTPKAKAEDRKRKRKKDK
jgi:hypothetical protein